MWGRDLAEFGKRWNEKLRKEGTMPSTRGLALRAYNGFNKLLARPLLPAIVPFRPHGLTLKPLGRGDGTWVVPVDLIHRDSVCYCVGVGVDISFDMELAARGAKVFCFDPTPRSIEFMRNLDYDRERINFEPIGIWRENAQLKFYAPMNPDHPNYSTSDIHGTSSFFLADCRRLTDVMRRLGHDHLDLLKLDIEGSWYEVLEDVLDSKIGISILCVEFDTPTSLLKVTRMIRALRQAGFVPVNKQRDNYLFVNKSVIP
jgi:FkbM family methyltransferase